MYQPNQQPNQHPTSPPTNPNPVPAGGMGSPTHIAQNPLIQQQMQQNPAFNQYVQGAQQNYQAMQGQHQPAPQQQQQPVPQPQPPVNQNFLPAAGQGQVSPTGFVPDQTQQPPPQQQQQQPPQYQQPAPQQQQQPAPQQQPDNWEVSVEGYENVPQEILQEAVDRYHEQGLTQEQAQQALAQEAQMGGFSFGDLETKQEYAGARDQLEDALVQRYGQDGAVDAFKTIYQNIHAQGGDALLHKFLSDPEMLEPDIVMGYLNPESAENPYLQHMRDNAGPVNPGFAPGQPGAGNQNQGGDMNMGQIQAREKEIYARMTQGDRNAGQELVQLGLAKRRMAAQQNQNAYNAGMTGGF